MPTADRTAHCQHCGTDWTPPPKAGFPPKFCPEPECQEARRLYRNAQVRLARQARERQQRDRKDLIAKVMKEELAEISTRADQRRLAARDELGTDVRRLASARGDHDTYHALLEVASTALAWATRIRPDESAWNLPVEPEAMDYPELMAA
jgi:hypothetical protein